MDVDVNPWTVDNLDVYLYYCCPQCEHKSKTKPLFVNHAHTCHPESIESLKFDEVKTEIVCKTDLNIKEEVQEDVSNERLEQNESENDNGYGDDSYFDGLTFEPVDEHLEEELENFYDEDWYDFEPETKKRKNNAKDSEGMSVE